MSRLDELIAELCPNGVPFIPLSDVGTLSRGKRFVHADAVDKGIPCIHYGELYTYYGISTSNTKSFVREDLSDKLRYANKNDVIIVGAGENNIDIGIAVAYLGDEPVAIHDACYILKHNCDPRYISYCLRTENYHNQIKKYVSRGKICSISAEGIGKAKIPVPPLPVQYEIVRILDSFTELTAELIAELTSELTARKKQYYCYRGSLLTFDDMVNELEFDKLFQFQNGFAFKSGLFRDSGKPILRIQNIQDKRIDTTNLVYFNTNDYSIDLDQYVVRKGDIVVAMSGATTGKIGVSYSEEEFYLNQRVGKFIPKEDVIDNRYLYHLLSSYSSIIYTISSGTGAQPNLSSEKLKKLKTRVPSLEEQHRIANILDKLDVFYNDICNGISSEIVARQKQYEYYRDKLLAFKPAA